MAIPLFGVPDWIRTNDTRRRRPVLYPAELRIHFLDFSLKMLLYFTIFYFLFASVCDILFLN